MVVCIANGSFHTILSRTMEFPNGCSKASHCVYYLLAVNLIKIVLHCPLLFAHFGVCNASVCCEFVG